MYAGEKGFQVPPGLCPFSIGLSGQGKNVLPVNVTLECTAKREGVKGSIANHFC